MNLFVLVKARKLHYKTIFQGLPISIENRKGSYRHWHDSHKDEDGKTYMYYPYGYIRLTEGSDGDCVDCYIGPNKKSTKVFVVHQQDPTNGIYDEDKVMLGFDTAKQAKKAYLRQYDDPKFFQSISSYSITDFIDNIKKKRKHIYL